MKKSVGIISLFQHKIKLFVLLFMTLVTSQTSPAASLDIDKLPELGASAHRILNRSQQARLGKEFMQSMRKRVQLMTDPLIENYIQNLGHRLIAHTEIDPMVHPHFNFFVVNNKRINAFAGPDGHIGIHTGLLMMTRSEDELASVVAHEIAHVTQQHIARLFEKSTNMTIPNIAAMIASIALATQDAQAGAAALTATMATNAHLTVSEIRKNEKEADRVGIKILANAGFDPYSMPRFFERMYKEVSRFEDKDFRAILSTHPVSERRLTDSLNRAEQFGRKPASDSLDYEMIRARIRVLTSSRDERVLRHFQKQAKTERGFKQLAGKYGLALLHLKEYRLSEAQAVLDKLSTQEKANLPTQLLMVELMMAREEFSKSTQQLLTIKENYPTNKAVALTYTKSLLFDNKPGKAKRYLQAYIKDHNDTDPLLYFYLAEARGRLGENIGAYQAKAEQFYLMGELDKAVDYLKYALKDKDAVGNILKTIKARIDQIQVEIDEA